MNVDGIAPLYDRLARIVFGSVWGHIQMAPIAHLQGAKSLLIVGGGSGAVLESLCELNRVVFLELSGKMIDLAKRRRTRQQVDFVQADFLRWSSNERFDAILMPFFLDCFEEGELTQVIERVRGLLHTDGHLHVVDFRKSSWWRNVMVRMMYIFFWLTSGLRTNQLRDFDQYLYEAGFSKTSESTFIGGWVFYSRYQRRELPHH